MPTYPAQYLKCIEFVLNQEGYGNNTLAGDPGGLTIWGVSAASFPKDVEAMRLMTKGGSKAYALDFYYTKFWKSLGLDENPWPLNLCILDTAINCGIHRAFEFGKDNKVTWQEYLCNRVEWQINVSKSRYTVSLLNRIYRLLLTAKG